MRAAQVGYASLMNLLDDKILNLEGSLPMAKRSLSPVIRKFAFASRQHSSSMLSSGSLQIDKLFAGWTSFALEIKAAMPEISAFN